MKKLIAITLLLSACNVDKVTNVVAVKSCATDKWDTITVISTGHLMIDAGEGVAKLTDSWSYFKYNVCEFKIIK